MKHKLVIRCSCGRHVTIGGNTILCEKHGWLEHPIVTAIYSFGVYKGKKELAKEISDILHTKTCE